MPKKKLLILGAGGFGKAVAETAKLLDLWVDIEFLDDRWPDLTYINQYRVISNIQGIHTLSNNDYDAISAVGNNNIRYDWTELIKQNNIELVTIIHPSAVLCPTTYVGKGCCIMAGCIISSNVSIKDGVILNIGTLIDHDVEINDFSHLSVGVKVRGGQVIDSLKYVEVGNCI